MPGESCFSSRSLFLSVTIIIRLYGVFDPVGALWAALINCLSTSLGTDSSVYILIAVRFWTASCNSKYNRLYPLPLEEIS